MFKPLLFITVLFICLVFSNQMQAQEASTIPSVKVTNLKGETVDTKDFNNDGKPFVINFWATWCHSCILELTNINDIYDQWQ